MVSQWPIHERWIGYFLLTVSMIVVRKYPRFFRPMDDASWGIKTSSCIFFHPKYVWLVWLPSYKLGEDLKKHKKKVITN